MRNLRQITALLLPLLCLCNAPLKAQSLESNSGELYRPGRPAPMNAAEHSAPRPVIQSAYQVASHASPTTPSVTNQEQVTSRELAPPSSANKNGSRSGSLAPFTSMAGSLALVLGIFGVCVWFLRKANTGKGRGLPKSAFEVLGRAPLAARHQAVLLRCGDRVILVSVGPTGSSTLTEFQEGPEVHRLIAACKTGESGSFQEHLQEIGTQRHPSGFVSPSANLFG